MKTFFKRHFFLACVVLTILSAALLIMYVVVIGENNLRTNQNGGFMLNNPLFIVVTPFIAVGEHIFTSTKSYGGVSGPMLLYFIFLCCAMKYIFFGSKLGERKWWHYILGTTVIQGFIFSLVFIVLFTFLV